MITAYMTTEPVEGKDYKRRCTRVSVATPNGEFVYDDPIDVFLRGPNKQDIVVIYGNTESGTTHAVHFHADILEVQGIDYEDEEEPDTDDTDFRIIEDDDQNCIIPLMRRRINRRYIIE